ncbi:MAG: hypothetical protein OHK0023_07380 [Anaerolineae bacterium]
MPLIIRTDAESLFPSAIRFGMVVNAPYEELISGTIRIWQVDNPALDMTFDLDFARDGFFLNQTTSLVNYLWDLTPETAPEPFTAIRYEFTLKVKSEEQGFIRGEVLWQDTRRPESQPIRFWQTTDGPVALYSHNQTLAMNLLHQNVLRAYELVKQHIGSAPSYRIVIYDPQAEICLRDKENAPYTNSRLIGNTNRPCSLADAEAIYRRYGFTLLRRASLAFDALQNQLIDLIVGGAYAALWQDAPLPPAWFREGLIDLYRLTPNTNALGIMRTQLRLNAILPLSALESYPTEATAAEQRVWRAHAAMLTLYLASRFGATAPFDLARDPFALADLNVALQAQYQITLAQLYLEWQAWLITPDAERDTRWTPYLEMTPTPSATPTTTATASHTVSPTPTWTNTPFPTITPTFTPTPITPTPTNTPLPPGSIIRPSPTPVSQGLGSGVCAGGALPMLPLGVLIVLPILRSRRDQKGKHPR